jgi:RNA polymerase sigma factor (sigma-70 family)
MLRGRTTDIGAPANGQSALHQDEVALVVRIAKEDRNAFELLYRCYFPRLKRFIERVTRRPQLVEEILNDTMLVVWHRAHTYNLKSKVSTWIFAIAFRKALKALKRIDDPVDFAQDEIADSIEPGPEGELMQKELRMLLVHAMARLSAEQRAVIELTYYQGCAYREIAEIMGCPVDTVKTRMFHARRRLKTLLDRCKEGVQ